MISGAARARWISSFFPPGADKMRSAGYAETKGA
jgi:hypothetical protein